MGFQISGRCWPAIPGAGPYIPAWTVCGNELWRLGFDAPLKGLARGFTAHEIRSQLAPEIIAGSGQGPRNLLIAASDRPPPKQTLSVQVLTISRDFVSVNVAPI